jgi:hypothetical protein
MRFHFTSVTYSGLTALAVLAEITDHLWSFDELFTTVLKKQ